MDGLRENVISWETLPVWCKKDVDFALSAYKQPKVNFKTLLDTVTNKGKLWMEGFCQNLNMFWELYIYDMPEHILSNPEIMLSMVSQDPAIAQYLDSSLE